MAETCSQFLRTETEVIPIGERKRTGSVDCDLLRRLDSTELSK